MNLDITAYSDVDVDVDVDVDMIYYMIIKYNQ